MHTVTQAEWDAIHSDYKGVWTTERTDLPDWERIRLQYMGKRTLMRMGSLWIEDLSFVIVPQA
jgi:hypothetical protein